VTLSELEYAPNGFGWNEPTHTFGCVNVLSMNFGEYNTGYRAWMLEAKGEVCEETVPLERPDWWPDTTAMTAELKINVVAVTCAPPCEIGRKQSSATSCDCVAVDTEPYVGTLYQAQDVAVGSHVRVMLEKDNEALNQVTLRQWASPLDGKFPYVVDTAVITVECLEVVNEASNEFYQQVGFKAIQDNCRWTHTLWNEE